MRPLAFMCSTATLRPTYSAPAFCRRRRPVAMVAPAGVIRFLRIVGTLKSTKRAGWVLCGVPHPESVADHMYRMAIISLVVSDQDRSARVAKMALVHDLAEAIVGDITPHDGVSHEDKQAQERRALLEIVSTIDEHVATEFMLLWEEYEAGCTDDARLVKDIDKFEMILQADEYEAASDIDLQQFFESTKNDFKTPQVIALVDELRAQRLQRRSQSNISNDPPLPNN